MSFFRKRGLSPIIATLLLVAITLALAAIIFFWARSFIGENIQKQGQAVESLCGDVHFIAEAYDGYLHIENTGDVAIGGVEIKKEQTFGEITKLEAFEEESVAPGQTKEIPLSGEISVSDGETLIITPILEGETSTERKSYVCAEEFSIEVVVG